ncbi:MAG TPA: type I polyketide synthase, partial [Solirubrobacteraceae bacterium]
MTRSAIGTGPDDRVSDLVHAPLWGLLRSARSEHPDRMLRLVDLDPGVAITREVLPSLGLDAEPEIAWRGGRWLAPRLVAVRVDDTKRAAPLRLEGSSTALVTGGVGELGRAVVRHLVSVHGARHLLLTSRRGMESPGAAEFVTSLRELGAETVSIVACDAADRASLAGVLESIPADRPLGAVFHLAGVLDDGAITALTPDRLATVLRPKVDGAWYLHELTQGHDLSAFVLFSSAAGVMGSPGQANYAAANVFLDALTSHRRKQGLSGISLAWGLWAQQGVGMTAHLGSAHLQRMRRQGLVPMSVDHGLKLFDEAMARPHATVVPVQLELQRLQQQLREASQVPSLLRALVRPALRRAGGPAASVSALKHWLSALPQSEREEALLSWVREEVAAVLGLAGPAAVPADRPLKELGLDSLMAVELRNQLSARAQRTLPATLAFDYPTPKAIAELLLRQAFAELDVARPTTAPSRIASEEPIAIVSMACRTPGGVIDPEGYWALLDEGRDAIGPFPARWNTEALYDPDPEAVGKTYAREGGFLEEVEQFDATFFGISPREAIEMDPQQRLVLEIAWEALERAGVRPSTVNESVTGVYLGSMGSDYGHGASLADMDGYWGTGQASSVLSGRLAYVLGLQGPAMTVDTACSSSLVALHLACAALRQGECDLALAGGVQVISTAAGFVGSSRQRVLAPDGRCKPFSAAANGSGWSEGCGILVLERLADARRNGHQVLAVVRGSAVNQDGRSQGLTAPNGPSQQRVVRRALAASGLIPDDIDAVEAHGTGTSLGDPIEAGALAEVFGPTRREDRPLWLGSSKSNIGHAQAAAGILGVIKMVLALEKERLPKTLYVDKPSPHVAWQGSGLALLQEPRRWAREAERPRRAGVSSFGISGTNAHVVLEESPEPGARLAAVEASLVPGEAAAPETPAHCSLPLLVSGRDDAALRAQAGRWADWLRSYPQTDFAAVVCTAAVNRTHFDARAAIQVDGVAPAQEALSALAQGRAHPAVSTGTARPLGGVVFVFPGHGGQWPAMGRALLAESAVFAEAIAACDAALLPHTGWSVRAVLRGDAGEELPPLERVDVVQPVLFVMAIGLAAVWRSIGVRPDAVIGHSQGEIAAAVVSGALSLEDGARITAVRSRLVRTLAGGGGMAVVELPVDAVGALLEREGLELSIAVVNTQTSTAVSGDREAIDEFVTRRTGEGVFCRRV